MNTSTQAIPTPAEGQFVPLGHTPPPVEPGSSEESAAIMADMAGGKDLPIDTGSARRKHRISSQIILMVGVLLLSAAALYFMRRLGTGAGMSFVQPPIDFFLEQDQPDRLADHERMIKTLEMLGVTPQVPEVDKNPFHLIEPVPSEAVPDDAHASGRRAQERLREIDRALGSVVLHSIIQGKRPVANVNQGLVTVGDTVAGILTVVEIGDRYIVVTVDEETYQIQMKERTSKPQRRSPRRN